MEPREQWPEGPMVHDMVCVMNTMLTLCSHLTATAAEALRTEEIAPLEHDAIVVRLIDADDVLRLALAMLRW